MFLCREEVENLSWKMMAAQSDNLKSTLTGLRADNVLAMYRQPWYDGRTTVEDFLFLGPSPTLDKQSRSAKARESSRYFGVCLYVLCQSVYLCFLVLALLVDI